jgi:hypothetical protein
VAVSTTSPGVIWPQACRRASSAAAPATRSRLPVCAEVGRWKGARWSWKSWAVAISAPLISCRACRSHKSRTNAQAISSLRVLGPCATEAVGVVASTKQDAKLSRTTSSSARSGSWAGRDDGSPGPLPGPTGHAGRAGLLLSGVCSGGCDGRWLRRAWRSPSGRYGAEVSSFVVAFVGCLARRGREGMLGARRALRNAVSGSPRKSGAFGAFSRGVLARRPRGGAQQVRSTRAFTKANRRCTGRQRRCRGMQVTPTSRVATPGHAVLPSRCGPDRGARRRWVGDLLLQLGEQTLHLGQHLLGLGRRRVRTGRRGGVLAAATVSAGSPPCGSATAGS